MDFLTSLIAIIYYAMVAVIAGVLIYNLIKARTWEKEVLYIIVLLPFLLRLFRLK